MSYPIFENTYLDFFWISDFVVTDLAQSVFWDSSVQVPWVGLDTNGCTYLEGNCNSTSTIVGQHVKFDYPILIEKFYPSVSLWISKHNKVWPSNKIGQLWSYRSRPTSLNIFCKAYLKIWDPNSFSFYIKYMISAILYYRVASCWSGNSKGPILLDTLKASHASTSKLEFSKTLC